MNSPRSICLGVMLKLFWIQVHCGPNSV